MSANCKSCSSNSNMSKTLPNQCSCKQEGNVDIPLTPITPYPDEVLTSLLDRLIQLLHRICSPNKSKPNKKLSTGNLNLCTSVSKSKCFSLFIFNFINILLNIKFNCYF